MSNFEPVATVVRRENYEDGSLNPNLALDWSGRNAENDFPVGTQLFTAAQMRQAERDALERAAQICDENIDPAEAAFEIRALIPASTVASKEEMK